MKGLFGLNADCVVERMRASGETPPVPSRWHSILWGGFCFGAASVLVFATWAFWGRWMYGNLGEGGAYAVWAALFILLSGAALNPLVIGRRTLARFYALFLTAFGAYAVAWSASWFVVGGRTGEWLGSLLGTAILGFILADAFELGWDRWRMMALLFVAHSAGYFAGSVLFDFCRSESGAAMLGELLDRRGRSTLGKLLWGAAYGLGLGAGLGYALHACQARLRDELDLIAGRLKA